MSVGGDKSFATICGEVYRPRKQSLLVNPRHSDECVSLNVLCAMMAGLVVYLKEAGQSEMAGSFLQRTQRDVVLLLQKKGAERAQEQVQSRVNIFVDAWTDVHNREGGGTRLGSYFSALCTTSRPDVAVSDLVPDPALMGHRSEWLTAHGREVLKRAESDPRAIFLPVGVHQIGNLQTILIEMLSEVIRRMS